MADDLEEDMDDAGDFDDGGHGGSRGGSRKLILILIPVILLIAIAGGLYYFGVFTKIAGLFKSAPKEAAKPVSQVPQVVFYDLPEILVNLNSEGRRQNFLKIKVSLELTAQTDIPVVEAVMPRVIDNFQVYLRELRVDDLNGSEGMLRLREELLDRVNAVVKPAKVKDVLFKEMLVQ